MGVNNICDKHRMSAEVYGFDGAAGEVRVDMILQIDDIISGAVMLC